MADKYGIQFHVVPVDDVTLFTTPVPASGEIYCLMAAPDAPNSRIEVLSVSVGGAVLVVDAADPITVNLSFHDASADSDTTILTGSAGTPGDLKAAGGLTAKECHTIWSGRQSLDPGDTLNAVLTITTPTTAGIGYYFLVGYRVKEWNGQ